MTTPSFHGFSCDTAAFFQELENNNERAWFEANRERYQLEVVHPAQAFVLAMNEPLRKVYPELQADPRPNGAGSIFRIHRDTRFSRDKRLYKTNLGIFFWQGWPGKRERPGYYVHLEGATLGLYCGLYEFSSEKLQLYRRAVADPKRGAKLLDAIAKIQAAGPYTLGGHHYKRIPRGFDVPPERAELICFNTIYTLLETPIPEEFYSSRLVDYCIEHFTVMRPLLQWLVEEMNI
ncbi:MAG TPA: DUF2461 domain-containing protein [bacterium]|nr:DUF2461 domain-containing protein [bacterium]HPR87694.1 DUF2461 domain-containing protein [bacterium]